MINLFSRTERPDIAIDLGTANTRIITAKDGIVFDEPSICCFAGPAHNRKLISAGHMAAKMLGHTTGDLKLVRPLSRGVLNDINAAQKFLEHAIKTSMETRRISGLRAIIGVPVDATKAERNALVTAAMDVGFKSVKLWDEPLAAAVGAGIDVTLPVANLIVECGAGITEAAIISLGGICAYRAVRLGGESLNHSIMEYLHSRYKFQIGEMTAERVKCEIFVGMSHPTAMKRSIDIKGHNLLTGLPENAAFPTCELASVVDRHMEHIVEIVMDLLNDSPPEICADIQVNGILLTGGGASAQVICTKLEETTGLRCISPDLQISCVINGLRQTMLH